MNLKNKLRLKGLQLLKSQIILTQKIEVINPQGKIVATKEKVSDSLVGNFLQILYTHFAQNNTTNYSLSSFNGGTNSASKIVGGSTTTTKDFPLIANGGTGSLGSGIVFGSGNNPVTALDYQLQTIINHGVGANLLSLQPQLGTTPPNNVGNITSMVLTRLAINLSGADITVNEVGMYVNMSGAQVCIYRDLTGGLVVPNTNSISASLTWQVTS